MAKRKTFVRTASVPVKTAPKKLAPEPKPETGRVKLVIHVLPETARRIAQDAGNDPLGYAVDRLCAKARFTPSSEPARPVFGPTITFKVESEAEILARLNNPQFKKKTT